MAGYETSIDREEADTMGITGRNLITGLSESLSFLSIESRTNRQKEKLRSELVSEHIDHIT
jgi:hypothetical protein